MVVNYVISVFIEVFRLIKVVFTLMKHDVQ